MNAGEILAERLKDIGAGGLCHVDEVNGVDCGCALSDFIPCSSDPSLCVPAIVSILPEKDKMTGEESELCDVFNLMPGDEYYTPMPETRS